MSHVCSNLRTLYPIKLDHSNSIGIFAFALGVIYILSSFLTILLIKSQEFYVAKSDGLLAEKMSNIFPIYVYVLWISAFASIVFGVIQFFVPYDASTENSQLTALSYAFVAAFQHSIIEGIAFLLMQKGLGKYAAISAFKLTLAWALVIFVSTYYLYLKQKFSGDILELVLDIVVFAFYIGLWLAPQKLLYRRPALYLYAKFWVFFRLTAIIIKVLFFFKDTEDASTCGYLFITLLLFAIFQPLICYWTLLQDSNWWQGIEIEQGRRESYEDIKSPLLGVDISIHNAQSLADTMDHIRSQKQVNMINFATIKVHNTQCIGSGSFSKVYKGTYHKKECAIKMIYTYDLTEEIIRRIAAEASILSSIKNKNVVLIHGVTVLPPSVCLILELCHFGSLSDLIRGYGYDWNPNAKRPLPMTLSKADRVYLSLGCARGLAAIHGYDPSLCHRDIKSFNFLVDSQFNVKIADLELGGTGMTDEFNSSGHALRINDQLANWMAPELLHINRYTQKSDLFSLGTVLWEIHSGSLPFDNVPQSEIRQKLKAGYRLPLPSDIENTQYGKLIQSLWNEVPADRPSSDETVIALEAILRDVCYSAVPNVSIKLDISPVTDFYNRWKLSSIGSLNTATQSPGPREKNSHNIGNRDHSHSLSFNKNNQDRKYWWSNQTSEPRESFISSVNPFYSQRKVISKALPLPSQIPAPILDILGTIQEDRGWLPFEATGQCWAIFTAADPHILVYKTASWNFLFGLQNDRDDINIKTFKDYTMDVAILRQHITSNTQINNRNFLSWLFGWEEKSYVNREASRESESSNRSVNQRAFDEAMKKADSRSAASSFLHSVSISLGLTDDSNSKHHRLKNSKITEEYIYSSSYFFEQLSSGKESHAIIPMTRKLGRTVDDFLCSLHAYNITSGVEDESVQYIAVLFNELKDNIPNDESVNEMVSGNLTVSSAMLDWNQGVDGQAANGSNKASSGLFGFISFTQSTNRKMSDSEQSIKSDRSSISNSLIWRKTSSGSGSALLDAKDFDAEAESWI